MRAIKWAAGLALGTEPDDLLTFGDGGRNGGKRQSSTSTTMHGKDSNNGGGDVGAEMLGGAVSYHGTGGDGARGVDDDTATDVNCEG